MKSLKQILVEAANPQATINKAEIRILRKAVAVDNIDPQALPSFDKYISSLNSFDLSQLFSNPEMTANSGADLPAIVGEALHSALNYNQKQFTPEELAVLDKLQMQFGEASQSHHETGASSFQGL